MVTSTAAMCSQPPRYEHLPQLMPLSHVRQLESGALALKLRSRFSILAERPASSLKTYALPAFRAQRPLVLSTTAVAAELAECLKLHKQQ